MLAEYLRWDRYHPGTLYALYLMQSSRGRHHHTIYTLGNGVSEDPCHTTSRHQDQESNLHLCICLLVYSTVSDYTVPQDSAL